MDVVREIVLMLIRRSRTAARVARSAAYSELQYLKGMRDEAAKAAEIARTMYRTAGGGAPQLEEERNRVVSLSTLREEFVTFSDGYVQWWPDGSPHGGLSSWHLRVIANELERRNRVWDARVRKALTGGCPTDPPI